MTACSRALTVAALGCGVVLGGGLITGAEAQYSRQPLDAWPVYQPMSPPYYRAPYDRTDPYRQVPAVPPVWNYDPYTDGTVATPRGGSG